LNDFISIEIASLPPQLSYSVNAVLTGVAVRGDVSRSNRTKARKEKTSVPKETPYESCKKQLFCYFFSASAKKVKEEIILFLYFLFVIATNRPVRPLAEKKKV
jgi:hypothetical protein